MLDSTKWQGQVKKFSFSEGQIRSNSQQTYDQFQIFREIEPLNSFSLRFGLQLEFNTSSANLFKLVLISEQDSLCIQIGGVQDNISVKQMGPAELTPYSGPAKVTEHSNLRLQLNRDSSGIYYLDWEEVGGARKDHFKWKGQETDFRFIRIHIQQSTSSFFNKHSIKDLCYGAPVVDRDGPKLLSFDKRDSLEYQLSFSEPIDSSSLVVYMDNQPLNLISHDSMIFQSLVSKQSEYAVNIYAEDSNSNRLDTTFNYFVFHPLEPNWNHLIINEILSDPYPDEHDFIELFNTGEQALNLQYLQVCSKLQDKWKCSQPLTNERQAFKPGSYLLLSTNPKAICKIYSCPNNLDSIRIDLPAMNNSEGNLRLLYKALVIDSLYYEDIFHTELLLDTEGVSLEKLQPLGRNSPDQWHSAPASIGYASPGEQNANYLESTSTEQYYLDYPLISPDGDGFQDLLLLHYSLSNPSTVLSLYVFNLSGQLIAQPLNQQTIGRSGLIKWDLRGEQMGLMRTGHYILYIEAFGPLGIIHQKKLAFSVASY